MVYRMLPVFVLAVGLLALLSAPVVAAENTHDGKFVRASGQKEFVMEQEGAEHSHMLSADAKVLDVDGKECKITDFQKGQKIRVTTKEGDKKIAIKVEALKE